jgi:protein-L-isoaspartate O-methyltransferase
MSIDDQSQVRGLMAARLGARTGIDSGWVRAFTQVPRESFLPDRVWVKRGRKADEVDRSVDPDAWWSLVYDEERSVLIQLDDGRVGGAGEFSSSSTMPLVMARMLAMLPGAGLVLEIGTGSGYNAAIMAHRYGAKNVMSIEVDVDLAHRAAQALDSIGVPVPVACGDGVTGIGVPEGPYAAIIATCAFKALPRRWLELSPQGRIVLPWSTRWSDAACLKLDTCDGAAEGRFVQDFVFMDARSHRPPDDRPQQFEGGRERTSALDPQRVSWRYPPAAFAVGLLAPGIDYHHDHTGHRYIVWDGLGSWAVIEDESGPEGWGVREAGPRRLWQVIERVYKRWQSWDAPSPDRFGVSILDGEGSVWLDSPDSPVATLPIEG